MTLSSQMLPFRGGETRPQEGGVWVTDQDRREPTGAPATLFSALHIPMHKWEILVITIMNEMIQSPYQALLRIQVGGQWGFLQMMTHETAGISDTTLGVVITMPQSCPVLCQLRP